MSADNVNRQTYVFFPPISGPSIYFPLFRGISLESNNDDSPSLNIAKKISRFVLTAFVVPFFSIFFIFYNTTGIAIKGTCAVIAAIRESFFNHSYEQYISDLNKHIAFATKDFITNYFIGFLCLSYTFYENDVYAVDSFLNRKIDEILQ